MHTTLRRLAVGGVLGVLALVGASVTRSGAEKKVAPAEVTSLQDLVGREVRVQFRRDAAGTATISPGIGSDVHNGAVLSLSGKLISANNDGLILEHYQIQTDEIPTFRSWIPAETVLFASHKISQIQRPQPDPSPRAETH